MKKFLTRWWWQKPLPCYYRFHNITQSTAPQFSGKHDTQLSRSYDIIQTNAAKAVMQWKWIGWSAFCPCCFNGTGSPRPSSRHTSRYPAGQSSGTSNPCAGRASQSPPRRAQAVSYTHLDVYKRQIVFRPFCRSWCGSFILTDAWSLWIILCVQFDFTIRPFKMCIRDRCNVVGWFPYDN